MESHTIQVNGIAVTCYEDGSVEKIDKKTGGMRRGFGSVATGGYLTFKVSGQNFLVHRLIAEAFFGEIPEGFNVAQKDGDRANNVPSNLEIVTASVRHRRRRNKLKGCSSKYRGVSFDTTHRNWKAAICQIYIGVYDNEDEAAEAWNDKAISLGYAKSALNDI